MSNRYAVSVLVFLALVVSAAPVQAVDGAREISQDGIGSFPLVISQPGHYVLTSDVRVASFGASAIRIDVDDVTIDLNGFSVFFAFTSGPAANGIDAPARDRVTIRNGTVRGFLGDCIRAGDHASISNVRAIGCGGDGLDLRDFAQVDGVIATDNGGVGIAALVFSFGPGGGVITRSVASSNGSDGIQASGAILDNVMQANGGDGFEGESAGAVIHGNTITANTGAGIRSNFGSCTAGEKYAYSENLIASNGAGTVVGNCITEVGENVCNQNTTCP